MRRTLLKSKIHRATVVEADLHYEGSITIDQDLMDAADLARFEKIEIYNVTRGHRFATYVIPGERGKGEIIINGAAAHKAAPDDIVILCCYADYDAAEVENHRVRLVYVDENNRIEKTIPEGLAATG